jgi:mannose-6-phosphate isomerase
MDLRSSGPLSLRPILKHRVWGGRSLARFGHTLPEQEVVGEAWLLADLNPSGPRAAAGDHAEERSRIENGPWSGRTLREAMIAERRALLGEASLSEEGGFPLLIKLLDARENLSVQVHPTRSYSRRHPGAHVKDETWFVLHAEPGAVLYRGLRRPIPAEEFRRHVIDGSIVQDLVAIPVQAGDVCDLPSGTCHALGAGIVVAEVQTPSDTTFRLFDWGRSGRTLHLDEGIEVLYGDGAVPQHGAARLAPPPRAIDSGTLLTTRLCAGASYLVERIEVPADAPRAAELALISDDVPVVLLPLAGAGRIIGDNQVLPLRRGHATLLPAALRGWSADLAPGSSILRIELPHPRRLV